MKTLKALTALALLVPATICSASEGIFTYTVNNFGTINGTVGWDFRPTTDISVTSLGIFQEAMGSQSPLTVGLWDQNGSLLASASVTSSDPLFNQTLYQSITPVTLTSGTLYFLGAYSDTGLISTPYEVPPGGSATTSPEIRLGGAVWNTNGVAFPSDPVGPPGSAFLAPNFQYTVPEPTVAALLVLGSSVVAWQGVRRIKK
jgi:hypothetical protein